MDEEIKNEEITEEENKEEETKEEEPEEEEAKEEAQDEAVAEDEKPLDKMTVKDLREVARKIPGVTGATSMKKDDLLALIKEYRGIKDKEPAKKKKVVSKEELSVKVLKKKVVQLKAEKEAAREATDKEKIDILRRRINRLKKRTRKVAQS